MIAPIEEPITPEWLDSVLAMSRVCEAPMSFEGQMVMWIRETPTDRDIVSVACNDGIVELLDVWPAGKPWESYDLVEHPMSRNALKRECAKAGIPMRGGFGEGMRA